MNEISQGAEIKQPLSIKTNFMNEFHRSNAHSIQLERQAVIALCTVAASFLLAALFGFITHGHQWGFAPINAMSSNIPAVLLHNMTSFGDGIFIVALLLTIATRNIPLLYTGLLAAIIGGLLSQCLKRYFNAERPPAVLELDAFNLIGKAYYSRSFPSGHTLTAFLMATVFICFTRNRLYQVLLACAAMLVGLSRVWLGVHWLLDILVGAALGIFAALFAVYIAKKTQAKLHPGVALFALALFTVVTITALIEPNDYQFAQAMISLTAVIALWRVYKFYLAEPIYTLIGSMPRVNIFNLFFVTLALLTVYRIIVILQPHLSLFYDEAYYYHWSLTPDLGYYSKPPMVAWFIYLSTAIAGHTVLGVKLSAPLLYSASAYLIYKIGQYCANQKAGVYAGLIFITAPVVGFNSEFITTDAPLIFFWCLSLLLFLHALQRDTLLSWLYLGLSVGLGMLSKYTMAILPLSLLAYLAFSSTHRPLLKSYKPWLAAVVAGLLFSLNLWWNSQNSWISFAHTSEISQQGESTTNIKGLFEFLMGQIFVLGPVWFYLGVTLFKHRKLSKDALKSDSQHAANVFLFTMAGILIVISLQALTSRAFINWAAPWIVGGSLLLGVYAAKQNIGNLLRIGLVAHLLLLSAFYHWPNILDHLNIEQTRKNTPYQRLAGWEGVSRQINPIFEQSPDAVLASDSRDLLAYVGFHARPGQTQFARWNPNKDNIRDHYDLKYNFREYTNTDTRFVYISKQPAPPKLLARFDTAQSLNTIIEPIFKDKQHIIYVYTLQGFNGYE